MSGIVPRDYQLEAAAKVGAAFNDGARRVVLVAPTGSGKGTMGVLEVERALRAVVVPCSQATWRGATA